MTATIAFPRNDWLARLRSIIVLRPGQRHMTITGAGVEVRGGYATLHAGGSFAGTNFFNVSYTGSRNNFSGTVGWQIVVGGATITVVALGRSVSGSITTNHRVGLWTLGGTNLETVTVNGSSPVDALGYAYEVLGTPRVLSASTNYVLGSEEFSGGDLWRDLGSISNHVATATIAGGRYSFGSSFEFPVGAFGGAENGYVPATFFT